MLKMSECRCSCNNVRRWFVAGADSVRTNYGVEPHTPRTMEKLNQTSSVGYFRTPESSLYVSGGFEEYAPCMPFKIHVERFRAFYGGYRPYKSEPQYGKQHLLYIPYYSTAVSAEVE